MTYGNDPQGTRDYRGDRDAHLKTAKRQIVVAIVIAVLVLSAGGYCFWAVIRR